MYKNVLQKIREHSIANKSDNHFAQNDMILIMWNNWKYAVELLFLRFL